MPLNLPTDEVFLTTEEVLEYLQVNLRTVYRLIKAGKIPAVRVGRQWRFRKRDIDAWLDSQRSRRSSDCADGEPDAAARRRPTPRARRGRRGEHPRLLSKTLALAEYEVDTAPDATGALDRLRDALAYNLLIADLQMPGMDGLTLIRRSSSIKPDLPIIIITGFSTESSAIEAVNLGVAGYLTKPFRVPQVLAAAAKALGAPPPRTWRRSLPRPIDRNSRTRAVGLDARDPSHWEFGVGSSGVDTILAVIQLSELTKSFGDRTLLEHVTWQIGDGDRVGLCGPNGAGKTTLLKMLAGLDEPDSGGDRQAGAT